MSLIIPANSLAGGGYNVDNSCRFQDSDSSEMSRAIASTGNNQTWTVSAWVKRVELGSSTPIFGTGDGGANNDARMVFFDADDKIECSYYNSGFTYEVTTNRLFRDVSAWYHICILFDTTEGTASNRVKIYVNGTQETSLATASYPSENASFNFGNTSYTHYVNDMGGRNIRGSSYISELVYLDGTASAVTNFGEFDEDSGIWKAIDVEGLSGSKGTNGVYLDFEDSANLGNDVWGGTDFTEAGLDAQNQTTDTPTNNFCTLNPLSSTTFPTFSEGNTKTVISTSDDNGAISRGNIFVSKGKWYWEVKLIGYSALSRVEIGVETADSVANNMGVAGLFGTGKARGRRGDANTIRDGNTTATYSSNLATNDIVGVALDIDSGTLIFYTNGVSQETAFSDLTNDTWSIALGQANSTYEINTGNAPYTIASGNADANGYGNFEYAVPTGYLSLCTKNISEVNS